MYEHADVLICGGGPSGLLTGLGLVRMGIATTIVEKSHKTLQAKYGRAATLYPRTLEILDQLEVLEPLTQVGYISQNYVNYKAGKKAGPGGFHTLLSQMHDTYHDFVLNIRQKYSEEIFQEAFEAKGGKIYEGTELIDLIEDDSASDNHALTAILRDHASGQERQLRCKFIIGADGTRSAVRKLANIPFTGDSTGLKWFRIDAVIKTNMPDARSGLLSVESPGHGNVLWMALDHGRTRIGFALPPSLFEKYGSDITEEQAKEEAQQAVAPFSLEFEQVDWWKLYRFWTKQKILLVGDACHCHSSGTAQGMNTGVHDAVNLAWKLGGVIRGWYDESILQTYEDERKTEAQRVNDNDKTISSLVTGKIPEGMAKPGIDPFEVMSQFTASTTRYTIGLDIHYELSVLNQPASVGRIGSGYRGPDVLLWRPGSGFPTRLLQITKNVGNFQILVFTGNPALTHGKLLTLRRYLDSDISFTRRLPSIFDFLTIIPGDAGQADEYLGIDRFGQAFYDRDQATTKYGFSPAAGGIVILRPDGIVGFSAQLDEGLEVGAYLRRFIKESTENLRGADFDSQKHGVKEVEFDTEITGGMS